MKKIKIIKKCKSAVFYNVENLRLNCKSKCANQRISVSLQLKYFLFALLFLPTAGFAQKQWSLRECIDYATKHNIAIQQQELKAKNAEIDLNTAKNSRLPNLTGSVGDQVNFGMNSIQQDNGDGTYNSIYKRATVNSSSIGINSTVTLFNGFKTSNQIKARELDLLSATEGLAKAKNDLALNIASYFLDVLFKKEILRVYQEQVKLSSQQVERTLELKDAGKVPESQVFDIKSQHASNELNVTTATNDLNTSILNLTQQLNLSTPVGFEVEVPEIKDAVAENITSIQPFENIYNTAVVSKPEVKQSEYELLSSQKNLKIAKADYLPELSFSLDVGTSYSNSLIKNFGGQLGDNHAETVSLSLSIPIFNRHATRNSVRTARNQILNSQLALENVKQTLYKEIQQAYYNALAAQAKYESTQKALQAAEIAFNYMKEKYAVGKATVFEYNESQTKLVSSQSDLLQAKYDYIFRAKILDFYNGKEITL